MRVLEIGLSALPLLAALLLAVAPWKGLAAEPGGNVRVQCAEGRKFHLRIVGRQARVQLDDGGLVLVRKPSSLGQHFRSGQATLIIDGDFVAFARKGDWNWRDCQILQPS